MANWKEKAKEWNEKYDDMFDEFPATESEGSYLEEAEAFYKRVEKRRKKSHDKKN